MCYKSVRTFFEFLCNIYEYKVYASGCRRRCCCSVLVDKFKTTCDSQFAPAFVLIHSKSCCEGPFFSHPTGCVGTRSTRIKGIDSKWFELIISKRLPDAPPPSSSPPLPPKKRSAKKYKFKLNIASESLFAQCFAVSKEYFGADTRFPIDVCHMWTTLTWFIFSVVCSPCIHDSNIGTSVFEWGDPTIQGMTFSHGYDKRNYRFMTHRVNAKQYGKISKENFRAAFFKIFSQNQLFNVCAFLKCLWCPFWCPSPERKAES